jgi:hypothetical protein
MPQMAAEDGFGVGAVLKRMQALSNQRHASSIRRNNPIIIPPPPPSPPPCLRVSVVNPLERS